MKRMFYTEIGAGSIVVGYEVRLTNDEGVWPGVGGTIDEAVRDAERAWASHRARVDAMKAEAERKWEGRFGLDETAHDEDRP